MHDLEEFLILLIVHEDGLNTVGRRGLGFDYHALPTRLLQLGLFDDHQQQILR
jgi:hypothetical protein